MVLFFLLFAVDSAYAMLFNRILHKNLFCTFGIRADLEKNYNRKGSWNWPRSGPLRPGTFTAVPPLHGGAPFLPQSAYVHGDWQHRGDYVLRVPPILFGMARHRPSCVKYSVADTWETYRLPPPDHLSLASGRVETNEKIFTASLGQYL